MRSLSVVINFYSTVSTGTEHLMWMWNANREKRLLFTFHIIQLALFILLNLKPISGLMSAEILLCWISIVNSVICLSWGILKKKIFYSNGDSECASSMSGGFICILCSDLDQGWNSTHLFLINMNIMKCYPYTVHTPLFQVPASQHFAILCVFQPFQIRQMWCWCVLHAVIGKLIWVTHRGSPISMATGDTSIMFGLKAVDIVIWWPFSSQLSNIYVSLWHSTHMVFVFLSMSNRCRLDSFLKLVQGQQNKSLTCKVRVNKKH